MDDAGLPELLPKQHLILLGVLDDLLQEPRERLPRTELIAETYRANINTAKKALSLLGQAGMIQARRRAGNRVVRRLSSEQAEIYHATRRRIASLLRELAAAGFNRLEISAALLAAYREQEQRQPRIIYADLEFNELLLGRRELEQTCGQPVQPVQVEELARQLTEGWITADLIVTTFFCESRIRDLCIHKGIPLVALRTTPPLEHLLNFSLLPRDTVITLVVLSESIRQRIRQHYPHIQKDFPGFAIMTLEEIRRDRTRLDKTHILLTHKLVAEEHAALFRSIPRIISYNRFQDDEGLDYIRTLTGNRNKEQTC
ncbi:DNA-binding transcriptional regulator YhcF (GntR family) [Geothermobacter ehrlichii]|uniref:DNA-binding transcriptional regulator YhcF (GntR family) n=1 Tax=Geothermobacter ehrlichii TaxID=213224 RepID=A0A5D3WLX3_9BACT|nr:GntR family transcriptional regulator [Geothermobacter ehrlichii]TYO99493.1 DNA-binding transcriptional regulator YhcF (GntR family) [Geothermobacter ehrlichii]